MSSRLASLITATTRVIVVVIPAASEQRRSGRGGIAVPAGSGGPVGDGAARVPDSRTAVRDRARSSGAALVSEGDGQRRERRDRKRRCRREAHRAADGVPGRAEVDRTDVETTG